MNINLCEDEVYQRPWGKHKNSFFRLIYNSGSYGTLQKIRDGVIIEDRSVLIRAKDGDYNIEKFARENNFIKEETP